MRNTFFDVACHAYADMCAGPCASHPVCWQVTNDPECPDWVFDGLWQDSRTKTLPYTVQDVYHRDQTPTDVKVVVMTNGVRCTLVLFVRSCVSCVRACVHTCVRIFVEVDAHAHDRPLLSHFTTQ
jgi:hypothetical protein